MASETMKNTSPTKRPLWWASLSPLYPGFQSSLPCQGLCSFICSFSSVPIFSALLLSYFYLSLIKEKKKTNKQNKAKSLFPSSLWGLSHFSAPLQGNTFQKHLSIHSVCCPSPVNLPSRADSVPITALKVFLSRVLFCPVLPNLFLLYEGCFFLGLFDTEPSSWLSFDYFYCFLDFFLLICYLAKSGAASQHNKEPLLISAFTPKMVYHCHGLDRYLHANSCKSHISS